MHHDMSACQPSDPLYSCISVAVRARKRATAVGRQSGPNQLILVQNTSGWTRYEIGGNLLSELRGRGVRDSASVGGSMARGKTSGL